MVDSGSNETAAELFLILDLAEESTGGAIKASAFSSVRGLCSFMVSSGRKSPSRLGPYDRYRLLSAEWREAARPGLWARLQHPQLRLSFDHLAQDYTAWEHAAALSTFILRVQPAPQANGGRSFPCLLQALAAAGDASRHSSWLCALQLCFLADHGALPALHSLQPRQAQVLGAFLESSQDPRHLPLLPAPQLLQLQDWIQALLNIQGL